MPGQRIGKPSENELMTASLSVDERVLFLKQVIFFQSMTLEQLKVLASVCEEEFTPKGTIVFKEGDPGGVVYVVVDGRVAIERNGTRQNSVVRLATMETRSPFGDMSLFDNSPRSTSALTMEDTVLLKLRVEPLIALMRQYPDMSLELIKILSQRIREANDQIIRLTRPKPRQLDQLYDKLEDSDKA
jgi:CRP/FNR family transcriptional regulator, cyclic AMP receptor protein